MQIVLLLACKTILLSSFAQLNQRLSRSNDYYITTTATWNLSRNLLRFLSGIQQVVLVVRVERVRVARFATKLLRGVISQQTEQIIIEKS